MVNAKDLVEKHGCRYSLAGTEMLAFACNYVAELKRQRKTVWMTKDVYPACGREFGCTAAAAERRLRAAAAPCGFGTVTETVQRLAAMYAD